MAAGLRRLTSRFDKCQDNADYIKAVDSSLEQRCSNSAGTKLIGCSLAREWQNNAHLFIHNELEKLTMVIKSMSRRQFIRDMVVAGTVAPMVGSAVTVNSSSEKSEPNTLAVSLPFSAYLPAASSTTCPSDRRQILSCPLSQRIFPQMLSISAYPSGSCSFNSARTKG